MTPTTSATPSLDADALRAWIGRTETRDDTVTAAPLQAWSATLDRDDPPPRPGDPLPPLAHWLYFLPVHRTSELGPDGHARRGGFLPPVPLPRRMWAGSRIAFERPLRVGDAAVRTSRIDDVQVKSGRSGPLVFVRVRHEIAGPAGLAIVDEHDIVYREPPTPGTTVAAPAEPTAADLPPPAWTRTLVPDDVLLFRYSALTFNGHRIHYDRRYVTEVEGYPGLVVHGPLIATLLLDALRRERPTAVVRRFAFRALRPAFDGAPLSVHGTADAPADDGRPVFRLWASGDDGRVRMAATAAVDA